MSGLSGVGLAGLSDAQLLDEWRSIEARRRALEVAECALIAQVERRGLPGGHGCTSTVAFAGRLLRRAHRTPLAATGIARP